MPLTQGFSENEQLRYARNVILKEVGWPGQARLRAARVAVVGAGGLGSAALLYLAAAGVGHLGLVDGDAVELSNLQRQILYRANDQGRRKATAARDGLTALNPHCQVETHDVRVNAANIGEVLRGYQVVLDASDNFPTRLVVAEYCWRETLPLVSAAVSEFAGQLLVVDPAQGSPCYRCLVPEALNDASAASSGILGAVAGVMGCLQALETVKLLVGRGSDLTQRLLAFDGLTCRFHLMARVKTPECPLCGEGVAKE